jgi:hypothetical protein
VELKKIAKHGEQEERRRPFQFRTRDADSTHSIMRSVHVQHLNVWKETTHKEDEEEGEHRKKNRNLKPQIDI